MVDWDGATVLRTPRLHLRTFRQDDLPLYAALNADPRVVEWLGGVALSREESDEIAEYAQELFVAEGVGLLAVERWRDGAFLGMCGLHRLATFPDDIEIAWRLAYEHWGHGYATEAATAWLAHAFDALGLQRVISITDPQNVRSLGVMRRLGMSFEQQTEVEEDGLVFQAVVYAITAERWRDLRLV
jgi:RimJ/RimL family protein N-acetyltransferase